MQTVSYKNQKINPIVLIILISSNREYEFELITFSLIGRWNLGHTIGKPEDSLIQTVDCPQVGGQMVNMVQTTISPIYGINNWLDCADICQNNLDCQYWQWSEPTSACYSVASFTGFIAADGFVTGARNCPLSTDSLVTLCPSKGSNSLMWRDTTEENGEFFNPGSTLKRGKYYSFRFRYIIYILSYIQ